MMKMNRDIKLKNTMRNNFRRKFLRSIYIAAILAVSTAVYGQTDTTGVEVPGASGTQQVVDTSAYTIKGIVRDARTQQPIVAAQIRSQNHNSAATTDEQGNFEIGVNSPGEILIVNAFDYNVREVPCARQRKPGD